MVAFEVIQGLKTQSEIAKEFKIHPPSWSANGRMSFSSTTDYT